MPLSSELGRPTPGTYWKHGILRLWPARPGLSRYDAHPILVGSAMQPLVQRIFHPTDFSDASGAAFVHALAIAIARKTTLTIMNASKGFEGEDWSQFPGISDTLKRWGLLDASSSRADVFSKLSIAVKKVGVDASDPADAILDFLAKSPTDLVVMATEAREGLPRLLKSSVAEKVTRVAGVRSLLVPADATGFVSAEDGSLTLKRILVPVAEKPETLKRWNQPPAGSIMAHFGRSFWIPVTRYHR